MTDPEKPAWKTDDQIEAIAWQLETAMASINKDPRAALLKGLERSGCSFSRRWMLGGQSLRRRCAPKERRSLPNRMRSWRNGRNGVLNEKLR